MCYWCSNCYFWGCLMSYWRGYWSRGVCFAILGANHVIRAIGGSIGTMQGASYTIGGAIENRVHYMKQVTRYPHLLQLQSGGHTMNYMLLEIHTCYSFWVVYFFLFRKPRFSEGILDWVCNHPKLPYEVKRLDFYTRNVIPISSIYSGYIKYNFAY